jgi:anti-sigma B factor antagonist
VTAELIHVADDLKPPRLVVDMSAVTGLGSRMIGQLAHLHKQVRAAGGRLALCQLQPDVFEVIQICNLTTLFSVYPSEDEAVKSFAAE